MIALVLRRTALILSILVLAEVALYLQFALAYLWHSPVKVCY